MSIKEYLKQKNWVKALLKDRWFWSLRNLLCNKVAVNEMIDDSGQLNSAEPVLLDWPKDLSKPHVGLVRDHLPIPYWTRYQRFLKNNDFSYEYFDIHTHDWLSVSEKFDAIIWRPWSGVASLDEARRKIYILEKHCGKKCFPTHDTILLYEDKMLQYLLLSKHQLPVIPTFISNDYKEAKKKVFELKYPLVSKLITGSSSYGMEFIQDPQTAARIVEEIFSPRGRNTYWGYLRQKDYVYFQEFIENEGYDLRVIVIGDHVFGYYRKVPKGDYRASGMGLVEKCAIPVEAMQLARRVCRTFGEPCLAVDLLRDKKGVYHIIEVSAFIGFETDVQLQVDGIPGAYVFSSDDQFAFVPGKFWIQELTLHEFFSSEIIK